MIERGQHFGFALEARESLGVSRQRRGEHLDGDGSLQVGVGSSVHLAHATHADLGDHFVRAEACAGNQSQTGGNYSGMAALATQRHRPSSPWCKLPFRFRQTLTTKKRRWNRTIPESTTSERRWQL
jgi:hypothetical protein